MNTTPFDPTKYDQEAKRQVKTARKILIMHLMVSIIIATLLALNKANNVVFPLSFDLFAFVLFSVTLVGVVINYLKASDDQMYFKHRDAAKHFGIYKPDSVLLPYSTDEPVVYKNVIALVGDDSNHLAAYDQVTIKKNFDGTFIADFTQGTPAQA